MTYAENAMDGTAIWFEDDGGPGSPLVLYDGFMDTTTTMRDNPLAIALREGTRRIFVDHRGQGRSDKPHDPDAYAMPLRVADAVAVLDQLDIQRAHFAGLSWGGRLVFGIGEHAPERALSLIAGGQQPYAWPDSPANTVVTEGLRAARTRGMVALVEAMEAHWNMRFPDSMRAIYLEADPLALDAAWTHVRSEGPVSTRLHEWRLPCLIFLGEGDTDFFDLARRAADEIPGAVFVANADADHMQAHVNHDERVLDAVRALLRR